MSSKHFYTTLIAFALILCTSCKKEKLAVAGSGWQEIAIIDKASGNIEWSHKLGNNDECNDIELTKEGNVLYAYKNGACLIDRKENIIWDYKAGENEEIHSASQLKDGGYLIGVCGTPTRIVELDNAGKQRTEIKVNTASLDIHRQFRQITKANDGTYIIPLMEKKKIIRVGTDGKLKGSVFVGGNGIFSVKILNDGKYLVSCCNSHNFTIKDPNDLTYYEVTESEDIKGASLLYVGEIFLYENGNKLIANSNMMSDDKSQPALIEINPNNELVWSLPFNKNIKNITAVYSFFE